MNSLKFSDLEQEVAKVNLLLRETKKTQGLKEMVTIGADIFRPTYTSMEKVLRCRECA